VAEGAGASGWTPVEPWLEEFLASAYGPRGLGKLVLGPEGSHRLVRSGSAALREADPTHPDLQPYLRLAEAVAQHAGDQASMAVLLAARLVRLAQKGASEGVPIPVSLDGYALALRQALATLRALTGPDPDGRCLASVAPDHPEWGPLVLAGLCGLAATSGHVPLDAVDLRTEPVAAAEWLGGLVVEPQWIPPGMPEGPVRILLATEQWRPGPRADGASYLVTGRHGHAEWLAMEGRRRQGVVDHLGALGVRLLVCARAVDEALAGMLAQRGVVVWHDAPLSALARLERATGSCRVARLEDACAADVGVGILARRPHRRGGWRVSGKGPAMTLVLPARNATAQAQAREDGERLLRSAGALLRSPGSLPGGGRWQRRVAVALRSASDAAPGKTPVAVRAAAQAFDSLADDVVRPFGIDVLARGLPPDAEGVHDVAESVRIAVAAAFATARQALRVDGRFLKRPSRPVALRGGTGRAGSPKGLPGDIPPLM
jgi:hypothetical protein